jgi:16S rRNA processing protein RimM
MEDLFTVGVVTTAHGIKGELKVFPTTDDAKRFKKLKEVIVRSKHKTETLKVESVKFFKQFVILGFEGLNRIEDVEQLRGCSLLVERKDAVPLEENEYYIADLIGLSVRKEDGTEIGTLFEVLETGANDVYVVKREGMKNLLLPAISQCILDVQPEQGFMTVHIMEGLEDL